MRPDVGALRDALLVRFWRYHACRCIGRRWWTPSSPASDLDQTEGWRLTPLQMAVVDRTTAGFPSNYYGCVKFKNRIERQSLPCPFFDIVRIVTTSSVECRRFNSGFRFKNGKPVPGKSILQTVNPRKIGFQLSILFYFGQQ